MKTYKKACLLGWANVACAFSLYLTISQPAFAIQGDKHAHGHEHEEANPIHGSQSESDNKSEDHADEVSLTKQQMALANIIVAPVTSAVISQDVYAPGEV